MDLRNTIVTADAMNCHKDTVAAITSQKGDYVLALKGNRPLFYDEVRNYFDGETLESLKRKRAVIKNNRQQKMSGGITFAT